jgi:HSF-type DNA-binding
MLMNSQAHYIDYAGEVENQAEQGGDAHSIGSGLGESIDGKQVANVSSKTTNVDSFPVRLHYMLSELEKDGMDHIVSWQPHGRCFVVRDQAAFVEKILPL